ncbi:MAG: hypothetical protein HY652_04505 [Acidobacteria bacterium]|nr:hypothetical protein [Acidobacteriota bacterium]
MAGQLLVDFIHLLGAVFWIGSIFFVLAVLLPTLSQSLTPLEQSPVLRLLARRLHASSSVALALLVATGVIKMTLRASRGGEWFSVRYGEILGLKVLLVVLLGVLSASWIRLAGQTGPAAIQRQHIARLAFIQFFTSLLVLLLATFLPSA